MDRRGFLRLGAAVGGGALAFGPAFWQRAFADLVNQGEGPYGSIDGRAPDDNGIILPEGFQSRIVARAGHTLPEESGYKWHTDPDGGAVFSVDDGGWVYVSNQEERIRPVGGGAAAIRFNRHAQIVDAYRILDGTYSNCAGGPTPWGTWLSCEEHPLGRVWECDPLGRAPAVVRPAMGLFFHEAACVDERSGQECVYLTEDSNDDGRLYRFTPSNYPDLSDGVLEAAVAANADGTGTITWVEVDPRTAALEARLRGAHSYVGAEGVWIDSGLVYFTTKGDDTVWVYSPIDSEMGILYRAAHHSDPPLTGVDNIVSNAAGELFVAEDGGTMQLVLITPERTIVPFLQIVGQDESEIAGPAFDPSGSRLYLSSMRGPSGRLSTDGITYEISGPFSGSTGHSNRARKPGTNPRRPAVQGAQPPVATEPTGLTGSGGHGLSVARG